MRLKSGMILDFQMLLFALHFQVCAGLITRSLRTRTFDFEVRRSYMDTQLCSAVEALELAPLMRTLKSLTAQALKEKLTAAPRACPPRASKLPSWRASPSTRRCVGTTGAGRGWAAARGRGARRMPICFCGHPLRSVSPGLAMGYFAWYLFTAGILALVFYHDIHVPSR